MTTADGFQVFLADLLTASHVFQEQGQALSAVMPSGGPSCPDGGSPGIDHAMQGAAQLLGLLHSQLATVIGQHATRLQAAHTRYSAADNAAAKLAYDITNPGTV
jgi:hypothetical protein